jgi:hypothetical protein
LLLPQPHRQQEMNKPHHPNLSPQILACTLDKPKPQRIPSPPSNRLTKSHQAEDNILRLFH